MDSLQRRLGMIGGLGGSQETIDQLQEALADIRDNFDAFRGP